MKFGMLLTAACGLTILPATADAQRFQPNRAGVRSSLNFGFSSRVANGRRGGPINTGCRFGRCNPRTGCPTCYAQQPPVRRGGRGIGNGFPGGGCNPGFNGGGVGCGVGGCNVGRGNRGVGIGRGNRGGFGLNINIGRATRGGCASGNCNIGPRRPVFAMPNRGGYRFGRGSLAPRRRP